MCVKFIPRSLIGATQLGSDGICTQSIVLIDDWVPEQYDLIQSLSRSGVLWRVQLIMAHNQPTFDLCCGIVPLGTMGLVPMDWLSNTCV